MERTAVGRTRLTLTHRLLFLYYSAPGRSCGAHACTAHLFVYLSVCLPAYVKNQMAKFRKKSAVHVARGCSFGEFFFLFKSKFGITLHRDVSSLLEIHERLYNSIEQRWNWVTFCDPATQ